MKPVSAAIYNARNTALPLMQYYATLRIFRFNDRYYLLELSPLVGALDFKHIYETPK